MSEAKEEQTPLPTPARWPARTREWARALAVPVLAVFTALVVNAGVILLVGGQPLLAYRGLWEGAFGSAQALSETLVWATPFIFAGLAVSLAFKGGLFNIGAEGQLALAAMVTAWLGFALPGALGAEPPRWLHLPLALGGGVLAGAVWGGIPGWLKARTGAHEVLNTLMMNYVALLTVSYMLNGPLKDPNPLNVLARTPLIAESARLPALFGAYRLHWGLVLALLTAAGVWWLLWHTTLGFEIRTAGANPDAARYAGINYRRLVTATMALSGGLAGLAGAVEVAGLHHRHDLGFSVGYGFDAIAVALLGRNHPLGVVLAALLFGALRNGASRMQFLTQIPVDIISVVQGFVLLFVAADEIIRYIYRLQASKEKLVLTRGWGA